MVFEWAVFFLVLFLVFGFAIHSNTKKMFHLFPPGLEPRTFRVLGERDNHYTTETRTTYGETASNLETKEKTEISEY